MQKPQRQKTGRRQEQELRRSNASGIHKIGQQRERYKYVPDADDPDEELDFFAWLDSPDLEE